MIENNDGADRDIDAAMRSHGEPHAVVSGQIPHEEGEADRSKNRYFSKPENRVAFATLIVVGVYTAITAFILNTTNRQLTAVIQSNEINREAFTSTQRAFVTVSDLRMDQVVDGADEKIMAWSFTPVIENSGNTPTISLRYVPIISGGPTKPETGWNELYPGVDLPQVPNDPDSTFKRSAVHLRVPLGPKSKMPASLTGAGVGVGFLKNTIDKGWRYYVHGAIHYFDAFPGTTEHLTKFCYVIGASMKGDQVTPHFNLCKHWNCTDADCEADRREWEAAVRNAFAKAGKQIPADSPVGWELSGTWPN